MDSLHLNKKDLSLHIHKTNFVLAVKSKVEKIKEYPIVLGANPVDDKRMEGDRCTPEGTFKVRDFYPHKSWSKFIWIDYPTKESWKKHNKAKSNNKIPQNATIGGEIGIHGVPANRDNLIDDGVNWTWGCISLKNKDVNEIYNVTYKGMEVKIIN